MKLSNTIRILIIVVIVLIGCIAWTMFFISIESEKEKVFSIWLPDESDIVPGVQNVLKKGRRLGGIGGIGIMQIELTEEQLQGRYPTYKFRWITFNRDEGSNRIMIDYYGKRSLQATHIDHYEKSYKYKTGLYNLQDYTVDSNTQQLVVTLEKDWFVLYIFYLLIVLIIGYFGVMFLIVIPYSFTFPH